MILHTVHIENFRQISGSYKMAFAPPGAHNVTLVLGDNGSGKSTLLNALRWCLYGSIEMENPDELLSHHAVYKAEVGQSLSVQVSLQFEHRGSSISVHRAREYEKADGGHVRPLGEERFEVTRVEANGETRSIQDPTGFVLNLLPEKLSKFFFFQGESILQMALQRSRDDVREGVETFLDLRVLDLAVDHLKKVESDLEKELKKNAGADVQAIQDAIDGLKDTLSTLEQEDAQLHANIAATESQIQETRQRLTEIDQFRPVFEEISQQETILKGHHEQRLTATADLCKRISEDGFLLLAKSVLEDPIKLADQAVEKGELPAKIKPKFVTDLIDRGVCICNRPLSDDARSALVEWRAKTGLADLEEAILNLRNGVHGFEKRKEDAARIIRDLRTRIANLDEQIRVATEKKSAAERKVADVKIEEAYIRGLRDKYEQLQHELVDFRVKRERKNDSITAVKQDLGLKEKERTELVKKQASIALAGKRIDAVTNVRNALVRIREEYASLVQQYLDAQLKASWTDVAQLPRRVSFNADFSLGIEERGGTGDWVTSAPSEANCAVLALTFVAALIRFAKEVSEDRSKRVEVFAGGEFPLVMDAPFAKMDVDFKSKVPKGLARVVPQVVLISSLDQWSDEVESSLGQCVGRAYVLSLHKPGEVDDVRVVSASGRQVNYVYTDRDAFTDWTEIQELT